MRVITLQLTEDECNQVANLFQTAVRAEGIPAAERALPILHRIQAALAEPPQNVVPLK